MTLVKLSTFFTMCMKYEVRLESFKPGLVISKRLLQ